ncbi:MAG: hypothetical protein ACRCYT_01810, partial [Cetobacterium sp.]
RPTETVDYTTIRALTIDQLKEDQKNAVDSLKYLYDIIHNRCLKSQEVASNANRLNLPELNENECFYWDGEKWLGLNLKIFESSINDLFDKFNERVDEALKEFNELVDESENNLNDLADDLTDQLNGISNSATSKLQMIWRMYSILTGSQRYLSGNVLTLRTPEKLERVVTGGRISDRVASPRRVYNGNVLVDRKIIITKGGV